MKQKKKNSAAWDRKIRNLLEALHAPLSVEETYIESVLNECDYLTRELTKLGLADKEFELTDEALTLEMAVQNDSEFSIKAGTQYTLARYEEKRGTYVIGIRYDEADWVVYIGRYELPCMDMELLYDPDEEYRTNMAKEMIQKAVSRSLLFTRFIDLLDREIALVSSWGKGKIGPEDEDPSVMQDAFTDSLSEDEMGTILLCVMLGMSYYGQNYWELAYSESAAERALRIVEYAMDIVKVLDDDLCLLDNDTPFVDSPELTKMYAKKGFALCEEADKMLRACSPQSGKDEETYGKS